MKCGFYKGGKKMEDSWNGVKLRCFTTIKVNCARRFLVFYLFLKSGICRNTFKYLKHTYFQISKWVLRVIGNTLVVEGSFDP